MPSAMQYFFYALVAALSGGILLLFGKMLRERVAENTYASKACVWTGALAVLFAVGFFSMALVLFLAIY